jgi:hypothetical protein
MASNTLSRFLLLNKLVTDYNERLGTGREDEQLKTYQVVPDAAKHAQKDQMFVHFSFKCMVYFFWGFNYDTKKNMRYEIATEATNNRREHFNSLSYLSNQRLLASVFELEDRSFTLRQNPVGVNPALHRL